MAVRLSRSHVALAAILAWGMGFAGVAAAQTSGSTGTTTGTEATGDPVQMMFKRIDTDGNGSISESELTTWRSNAVFRLDTDGDGKVTKQEVDAYMTQQQSQGGKPQKLLRLLPGIRYQWRWRSGPERIESRGSKTVPERRYRR